MAANTVLQEDPSAKEEDEEQVQIIEETGEQLDPLEDIALCASTHISTNQLWLGYHRSKLNPGCRGQKFTP